MVKNYEDAYRLKNLSLFIVEYDNKKGQKNKNMGKTGLYGMSPCWGGTVTYLLFHGVSKKNTKNAI